MAISTLRQYSPPYHPPSKLTLHCLLWGYIILRIWLVHLPLQYFVHSGQRWQSIYHWNGVYIWFILVVVVVRKVGPRNRNLFAILWSNIYKIRPTEIKRKKEMGTGQIKDQRKWWTNLFSSVRQTKGRKSGASYHGHCEQPMCVVHGQLLVSLITMRAVALWQQASKHQWLVGWKQKTCPNDMTTITMQWKKIQLY